MFAATSSDCIHYLLWTLEMYGSMVVLGVGSLLESVSSRLDRALSACRICRGVFLPKRGVSRALNR